MEFEIKNIPQVSTLSNLESENKSVPKLEEVKISKIQSCPLYDNISKSIPPDFKFDPVEVCGILSRQKEENQELIAVLIHHHRMLNNVTKIKKNYLVYNGKTMSENKTGCLWNFNNLPEDLQRILAKFALYLK
jgi:hypothetical protein